MVGDGGLTRIANDELSKCKKYGGAVARMSHNKNLTDVLWVKVLKYEFSTF